MARINIEECWWSDPRRDALRRALKSEIQDQVAIRAWRLALEFWTKGCLIPWRSFRHLEGAFELIECDLAIVRDGPNLQTSNPVHLRAPSTQPDSKLIEEDPGEVYVYVRGSCDFHSWAKEQKAGQQAGGEKSAQRPRDALGRLLPKIQDPSKIHPSESRSIQVSGSVSGSNTNTNTNYKYTPSEVGHPPQAVDCLPTGAMVPVPKKSKFSDYTREKMRSFIGKYAEGYKAKYGGSPEGIKDKALMGKLGYWIEHVSEVRATSLVEVYLQISYRPFDENCHDLWQFFRHLNRIGLALDTGQDKSGSVDWSKVFAGHAA